MKHGNSQAILYKRISNLIYLKSKDIKSSSLVYELEWKKIKYSKFKNALKTWKFLLLMILNTHGLQPSLIAKFFILIVFKSNIHYVGETSQMQTSAEEWRIEAWIKMAKWPNRKQEQ